MKKVKVSWKLDVMKGSIDYTFSDINEDIVATREVILEAAEWKEFTRQMSMSFLPMIKVPTIIREVLKRSEQALALYDKTITTRYEFLFDEGFPNVMPCPFCDGLPHIKDDGNVGRISCENEYCPVIVRYDWNAEDDMALFGAIEIWNTRIISK